MYSVIGFMIALAVGMTGIGGGSFTVPALVLLAGLTSGEAVGTAFLFAAVLRLIAVPFYLVGKQIHSRYLWLLLQGAVPGLVIGIVILRLLNRNAGSPLVIILLGVILMASSSVTFIRRIQNQSFARKTPIGFPGWHCPSVLNRDFRLRAQALLERCLLLDSSEMSPGEVVGDRPTVWVGIGGYRQPVSLELWFDQHACTFAASRRRDSRRSAWLPAGTPDSRNQAQDGCCHDRSFSRATVTVWAGSRKLAEKYTATSSMTNVHADTSKGR